MEKNIADKFSKITKSIVGKGPENMNVKIAKNFVIVELIGVMTAVEKDIMENVPRIKEDMVRIKKEFFNVKCYLYVNFLYELFGVEPYEVITKMNLTRDTSFFLFVYEYDVESIAEGI